MAEITDKEKDPVCGMEMEATEAQYATHLGGKVYYFCSEECKDRFEGAPADFLETSAA